MAKQYSRSQQIGDEGHTFAARIVTALGQTWHDRRVDHGIDDLYWKPTDAQPTRTGTGLHTGEGLSEQGTLDLGGAQ